MVNKIYFTGICILALLLVNACSTKKKQDSTLIVCGEIEQMDSIYLSIRRNPGKEVITFWDKQLGQVKSLDCKNRIHFYKCLAFLYKNNIDSSRPIAQQLLKIYENTTHYRQLAEIYSVLGKINSLENNFVVANYYYSTSAEIILNFNLKKIAPNILQTLAMASEMSRHQKQLNKSIRYIERGQHIARNIHNEKAKIYYQNLFNVLRLSVELELPKPDFKFCRKKLRALKNHAFNSKGDSMENRHNYYMIKSDYHHKTKELDSCINNQLLTLKYLQDNDNSEIDIKSNLIALYCETGAYKKAGAIVRELKPRIKQFDESTNINFEENYVEYLIATEQTQKALKSYERLMRNKDRLYTGEYAKASAELSSIYELKNKESRIKSLSTKVNRKDVVIKRNGIILLITIGLLLIAILGFLWYLNAQKQKQLYLLNEKIHSDNIGLGLKQRLLRSQMDPHFIFNSLSALQSFIRTEKNELSLNYLGLFSKLLRGNLESSVSEEINLTEEIKLIENYLQLQQLRYDNSFEYNIILSEEVENEKAVLKIPPMLIQPFIENAVIHGVRNLEYPGIINLKITKVDTYIHIIITDNGKGFPKNKKNGEHVSYAISLVKERLELIKNITGQEAFLEIDKDGGEQFGVKVLLRLPNALL